MRVEIDDEWWPRPPRAAGYRLSVGVRAVDPESWLRPRPGDFELLAWKRALLERVGDAAFQAMPGTEAAGRVVLDLVAAATGAAAQACGRHPLDAASRLVAEDLCVVDVRGPDPVLVAGAVAMPSRWRLADKLGRDLLGVHAPVPGYAEQIGTATDQLMRRLTGERVMARTNWSIADDPALFQPTAGSRVCRPRPDVRTPADAALKLMLRVEYQTVRALAGTGAVLFTIRTAQQPLADLADRPVVAAGLLATLTSMSVTDLDHKGLTPYLEQVTGWLRRAAG